MIKKRITTTIKYNINLLPAPDGEGKGGGAMMKESLRHTYLIIALAGLFLFGPMISLYAVTGPGSEWLYDRRITLSPVTPAANFQVKVTLTSGQYTHMNATDGRDLRFYDAANNSCNYWIEIWNTSGTSTIWVKVAISGTSYLYLYYGNTSATAVSSGSSTFDFFDDFPGSSLAGNWSSYTNDGKDGTITVSGSQVTLSLTSTGAVSISSQFTPASTSFLLETKHKEGAYNRNRFYATTSSGGVSPTGFDYGYFTNVTPQIFWNGWTGVGVTANIDYLTRWLRTDGTNTAYYWYTFNYSTGATVDSRSTTLTGLIRFITISVTEVSGTSTIIDWVRVRQYASPEPGSTVGSEVANLNAGISAQTNVLCYGHPTGSATVTASGGSTPYSYAWSTIPQQNTQTAISLPAGAFTVMVTESSLGLQDTANVNITQPDVVSVNVTDQKNISCFAGSDGTITVSASGGSGTGYEFSKDNGAHWTTGATNPYTFTNLSANVAYKIRAKDSNGCMSPEIP